MIYTRYMKHLLSILIFFSLYLYLVRNALMVTVLMVLVLTFMIVVPSMLVNIKMMSVMDKGRSPILMVTNKLGFFLKINSFNQIRLIQLQKIVVQMHIKQQNFGNIMIHKKHMILEKK